MDITGTYDIPGDRRTVWAALNDPEVLRECIPGCQELDRSEEGFNAKVTAKVGPVKATFSGTVTFEEVNEPESYVIVGSGKGGAAGFAKGRARVTLEEIGSDATRLSYTVDAQVGGKLAQVGNRLIQGTAQKYANDFFACFAARLAPAEVATAEAAAAGTPAGMPEPMTAPGPAPYQGFSLKWLAWAGAAIVVLAIIVLAVA